MPHSETNGKKSKANGTMSEKPQVNGEKSQSEFLSHLTGYPVVSDSITYYKTNTYGAKSLSIANQFYATAEQNLYKPISPYLTRPYAYVAPYLTKADSIGVSSLSAIESRFPIVKEDTETVKSKVYSTATLPIRVPLDLAREGKNYVFKTYDEEYSKTDGADGIFKQAKAVISTELKLTVDALQYVRSIFVQKKEQAEKLYEKKVNNTQ